jgi:hypothetical protein
LQEQELLREIVPVLSWRFIANIHAYHTQTGSLLIRRSSYMLALKSFMVSPRSDAVFHPLAALQKLAKNLIHAANIHIANAFLHVHALDFPILRNQSVPLATYVAKSRGGVKSEIQGFGELGGGVCDEMDLRPGQIRPQRREPNLHRYPHWDPSAYPTPS